MSNSIQAFFNAIYSTILKKEKSNKTSVEKLASTFGITDKNTIKEITENAIVTIARKIANQSNKTVKQKYDEIVDLYKSQVNLSHRTSQSMLLQQYSTPATIGYLMGVYCKINQQGNYYEPSAGNGMLTIANSGKDFTVNEIDKTRFQNLEFQDIFKLITKTDSSKETYRSKYFDAIITNPPFATLNSDEYLTLGEYEIKHLDHKMAILALNSMKDNGKAAIIVGGHTSWDDKGRIQAGKNRIFLSYLYKNYNVEDIILIDGNALYSKMGTGFDTRIILINGRKPKAEGFAPLKNDVLAQVITTTDDLYSRFSKRFEDKENQKLSSEDFRTQMNTIIDSKLKDIATNKGKALRLRAKAISIKQKQLLQLGRLGVVMNSEAIALTTPFNKQIVKAMKKGYEPTDIFHLGKPFGELAKHIPDYKIVMTGKVLSKAMTKDKDHQLNWANFIDLPFFLNNPTAIFKSETIGYVVLTEVFDVNNKPVMISLHINKKMVITNIASLYVRNYETYKRWINKKLHLFINEKSDLFNYTQATIAVGSNKSQYKDIKKT